MFPFVRNLKRFGLTSPYGPVAISTAGFVFAWLFPPDQYSRLLSEPDGMFLDFLTALFFGCCVASFLLGIRTVRFLNPSPWLRPLAVAKVDSPFLYLIIPLAVGSAFCFGALRIYGTHVNFISLLSSQQGSVIKNAGETGFQAIGGIWDNAPIMLTALLWWALFRQRQLRIDFGTRLVLNIIWSLAFLLDAFTSLVLVSREGLMSLVAGSALIYLFGRQALTGLRFAKALMYTAVAGCALIFLFLAVSYLRGSTGAALLISSLLGYSIASYNRLAAIVHGRMTYYYGARGVYLVTYFQSAVRLQDLMHIRNLLGWPNSRAIWNSEFSSTALAGLNPRFIWGGVFGYLYSGLGWGTLPYLFMTGTIAGFLWSKFRIGSAFGVATYPWIVSWILLWVGPNIIFDENFVHLVLAGAALTIWDRLLLFTATTRPPQRTSLGMRSYTPFQTDRGQAGAKSL